MLPRGASNARQQMFDRARHPRGSKGPQDPRCRTATSAATDKQAGGLGGNDLARCSHASGRRDIPSRAFSYPRAVFYNSPSVYTFSKERSDFEELCCGGGEDLDPLYSGLLGGRKRLSRG